MVPSRLCGEYMLIYSLGFLSSSLFKFYIKTRLLWLRGIVSKDDLDCCIEENIMLLVLYFDCFCVYFSSSLGSLLVTYLKSIWNIGSIK